MGNIEIIQPTTKRRPIFDRTVAGTPRSISRQKSFSPVPQLNFNQLNKSQPSNEDTSTARKIRGANQKGFGNSTMRQPEIRVQQWDQPGQKKVNRGSDVFQKVRNFNDFLNELKKKMKFPREQRSQKTVRKNMMESRQIEQNDPKELVMNLRLQNEKIQLQKYKKLVERELSKNHSIENITLQNRKGSEKVLIIKYETLEKKLTNQPPKQQKNSKLAQQEQMIKKYKDNYTENLNKSIKNQQEEYQEKKRVFKREYYKMVGVINELRIMIQEKENGQSTIKPVTLQNSAQAIKNSNQNSDSNILSILPDSRSSEQFREERADKISSLLGEIDKICLTQLQLQAKIKQALQDDSKYDESDSQISATFGYQGQEHERA